MEIIVDEIGQSMLVLLCGVPIMKLFVWLLEVVSFF